MTVDHEWSMADNIVDGQMTFENCNQNGSSCFVSSVWGLHNGQSPASNNARLLVCREKKSSCGPFAKAEWFYMFVCLPCLWPWLTDFACVFQSAAFSQAAALSSYTVLPSGSFNRGLENPRYWEQLQKLVLQRKLWQTFIEFNKVASTGALFTWCPTLWPCAPCPRLMGEF